MCGHISIGLLWCLVVGVTIVTCDHEVVGLKVQLYPFVSLVGTLPLELGVRYPKYK